MSNIEQGSNGGANIKPVARPSIHYHKGYCPFACGEFTMDGNRVSRSISPIGENLANTEGYGQDELDNTISKHAHPIDVPRKPITRRQSSVDPQIENRFCKNESEILSKSLPAYFPSHLDFSSNSEMENIELHLSNVSNSSSNIIRSRSYFDESQNETGSFTTHQESFYREQETKNSFIVQTSIVISAFVMIIFSVNYSNVLNNKNEILPSSIKYDKNSFNHDMYNLGEKYNVNEDSILQLQTGISSISEKKDTDSFIFVYNSKNMEFDSNAFNEFINEVALVSAKFLRNESSTVRHIVVDTSSLVLQDSAELITKYMDEVAKDGVMLMTKIDSLPSSLAMALHYYCDEYNPLAKKSAIFFTLDLSNCSDQMPTHSHVEKCLASKWKSVPSANIGPLLSRVVSVLIDVTSTF